MSVRFSLPATDDADNPEPVGYCKAGRKVSGHPSYAHHRRESCVEFVTREEAEAQSMALLAGSGDAARSA